MQNGIRICMQAITVRDHDAGLAGMSLTDMPYPHAAENDVAKFARDVLRLNCPFLDRNEDVACFSEGWLSSTFQR